MKNRLHVSLAVLLLGTLACEPVFAIGWKEVLFIVVIVILLVGPPAYRFIRRFEKFKKEDRK